MNQRFLVALMYLFVTNFATGANVPTTPDLEPTADEVAALRGRYGPKIDDEHLSKIRFRHSDGTKGHDWSSSEEPPYFNMYRAATRDSHRAILHKYGCDARVLGAAQLLGSKSFVNLEGTQIYTKYKFKILQDFRFDGADKMRQIVYVVMLGGEAKINGEKIRVNNLNSPFSLSGGGEFLLAITEDPISKNGSTYMQNPSYIEIKDDRIFPPGGNWLGFKSGTTLAEFASKLSEISMAKGCH
jgi:hypothetical protein